MAAASSINQRGSLTSDPIRNFRFLVTFEPVGDAEWYDATATFGFTSVSGLSISTESIPYREGQFNTTVTQVPGQTTFSPITLQRGVTIGSKQNWAWMKRLFQANMTNVADSFAWSETFRVNVKVDVLAHPVPYSVKKEQYGTENTEEGAAVDDNVLMRFTVFNAWPTSVAYSDLSAGDNALMVEQLTLVHEGFNLHYNYTTNGVPADINEEA